MANHLIPMDFTSQIDLLKSRGLIFIDEEKAKKYLSYIGYYRLSVYWGNFYENPKTKEAFKKDINFKDILNLYIFDRKLRLLFLEAAERIEICLKVLLSDVLSTKYNNPFWYLNSHIFNTRIDNYYVNGIKKQEVCNHEWILDKINKNLSKMRHSNTLLFNFSKIQKNHIASWELVNLLTFGTFSNMMSLISGSETKDFYEKFNLPKKVLDNWVECIVATRNICAHYGLLYNRSFSTTPANLNKSRNRISIDFNTFNKTLFAQYFIFSYFIDKISPSSSWINRVNSLINEHVSQNSLLAYETMGFPEGWSSLPVFKNKF